MKFLLLLVLSQVILSSLVSCDGDATGGLRLPVINITEANYTAAIQKYDMLLIMFYAPWCGACKGSFPIFVKAAEILKNKAPGVTLAAVNCDEETNLRDRWSIEGYPTLKLFRKGLPLNYTGENREADTIVEWLIQRSAPPITPINTPAQLKTFTDAKDVTVVGFFESETMFAAGEYSHVAFTMDSAPFALVTDKEMLRTEVNGSQAVVVYKKFDEGKVILNESLIAPKIEAFVRENLIPYVVDYNVNTTRLLRRAYQGIVLILLSEEAGHFEKVKLDQLAKEYRSKGVLFMRVNTDEPARQRMLDLIGVKKGRLPDYRIVKFEDRTEEMSKYMPDKPLTKPEEEVRTFLEAYLAGNLSQFLLSADLPEDWDGSAVKVLVSSNFDEIVFDKEKHVLVKFFDPECPYSQELAPIYEELGENFEEEDGIVITEFDAFSNELSHTPIEEYPIVRLYKKGTNEMVEYLGENTLEGLTEFLIKHTSDGEAGPDGEKPTDEAKKDEL